MGTVLLVSAVLVLGLLAYIRLAPSDPARFHVIPTVTENRDLPGGVLRRVATGSDGLERLHRVALATPRTRLLAGSVAEGHVTYITRTRGFGFPDYTSVKLEGGELLIYARLRFGRRDFGVNRARVDAWVAAING